MGQGGRPAGQGARAAPRPAARASTPAADDSAGEAREKRFRERWGLLSEPERAAIRAEVLAENPGLARQAKVFLDGACLGRLADRMAAEEPRAP